MANDDQMDLVPPVNVAQILRAAILSQLILCNAHQPGVFYVHRGTAAYRIYPGCFFDHVGREHGDSHVYTGGL